MDVCIKGIDDKVWRTFKAEATKHGMKIGEFFDEVVREHENLCKETNWDKILHGEKTCKGVVTLKDLKEIREEFRKNFAMRKIS